MELITGEKNMADNTTNVTGNGEPAFDPAMLNTLFHQPEVQQAAVHTLDSQINEREAELAQLKAMREAVAAGSDIAPERRRPGRKPGPATSTRRAVVAVGRPAGSNPRHGDAIQAVLKSARNGLAASEIFEALEKRKQPGERKTWATYIAKMKKDGILTGTGERNSTIYRLA